MKCSVCDEAITEDYVLDKAGDHCHPACLEDYLRESRLLKKEIEECIAYERYCAATSPT